MLLAAPNQPSEIIDLLESHLGSDLVIQDIPVDFQFWGQYNGDSFKVLFERKKCPGDLYASWRDGRLRRQALEMASNTGPNFLILEGNITWDKNYRLRNGRYPTDVRYEMLTGLWLTCAMSGVWLLPSPNEEGTARLLVTAYNYYRKQEHLGLVSRTSLHSPWGRPGKSDLVLHFLSGAPDIGLKRAKWAWAVTGTLRRFFGLSAGAMQEIPEFGPVVSKNMADILDMECPAKIRKELK